MKKEYVRDGRSPTPSSDVVSRTMRSNKRKDTGPEVVLRRRLREEGLGGYRLHWKIPGRPDICYPGRRISIFVNGCFWHRCPICDLPLPKNNTEFWRDKFERNVERDERNRKEIADMGWNTITIWECEVKNSLDDVIRMIKDLM
jgi:DNA mismatch endonuclease (patch repair protein)